MRSEWLTVNGPVNGGVFMLSMAPIHLASARRLLEWISRGVPDGGSARRTSVRTDSSGPIFPFDRGLRCGLRCGSHRSSEPSTWSK